MTKYVSLQKSIALEIPVLRVYSPDNDLLALANIGHNI